jgi:hypothetical protein
MQTESNYITNTWYNLREQFGKEDLTEKTVEMYFDWRFV